MTFISVVARDKFISIVSDGKVSEIEEDIGDYKKFTNVGKNQFLGVAGSRSVADFLFEKLTNNERVINLENEVYALDKFVKKEFNYQNHRSFFVLGGLDIDDKMKFFTFSNNPIDKVIPYIPNNSNDILCAFLGGSASGLNNEEYYKLLIDLFKKNGIKTVSNVVQSQKELNDIVAKLDDSVNTEHFPLEITTGEY